MNEKEFGQLISNQQWRLNNLYYIRNKNNQRIKFLENNIQCQINQCAARYKMILKARQFGVTTNEVIKLLDYTMFHENVTTAIIAHEDRAIVKIFEIVRRAYNYFPIPELRPELYRGGGSKYELYFPSIDSKIYCALEGRGGTISRLHVSEVAFMQQDRLIATLQCVPIETGHVTFETTANGAENFFHDIWFSGYDEYERLFFPWFFHAEYALPVHRLKKTLEEKKFCEKTLKNYGIKISDEQLQFRRVKISEFKNSSIPFEQEYPENDTTCFRFSGNRVTNGEIISELEKQCRPVIEYVGPSQLIAIYDKRVQGKTYVVGADCAQGVGGDKSAASVLCVEDREEVGFICGDFAPFKFAHMLNDLAKHFSKNNYSAPLLAVESNNHGHAVLLELIEHIKYPNLYYTRKNNGDVSSKYRIKSESTERPGWLTDSVSRPIMMNQFIETVQSYGVKLNAKQTLLEMRTLVNNRGKIEAMTGKHDDCVVATAIAVQMLLMQLNRIEMYKNIGKSIMV